MFIKTKLTALDSSLNNLKGRVSNVEDVITPDSKWIKLTMSTNWSGSGDYCAYRRIGRFVEIRFLVTAKNDYGVSTTPLLIAYGLPDDCQPTVYAARNVAYHNGQAFRFDVFANSSSDAGKISLHRQARKVTKGYIVVGHIMYIGGDPKTKELPVEQ